MSQYQKNTRAAKAEREAAIEAKQAKRELAKTRITLAAEELPAAYAYRNKLIAEDSESGLSLRRVGKAWDLHWTMIREIIQKQAGEEGGKAKATREKKEKEHGSPQTLSHNQTKERDNGN